MTTTRERPSSPSAPPNREANGSLRESWLTWGSLAALLLVATILRATGVGHAIGSHPDERHMVGVVTGLDWTNLNPKSFSYGSFPYYLAFLLSRFCGLFDVSLRGYDGIFYVGRSMCIAFAVVGVALTARLGFVVSHGKWSTALIAAFLLTFNFFHLQLSRFFTVDVILCTLTLAVVLLAIAIAEHGRWRSYLGAGICVGMALATKVSALYLLFPLLAAAALNAHKLLATKGNILTVAARTAVTLMLVLATFVLCQPYAVLDAHAFFSQVMEQINMARGQWRPPYTVQYEGTSPLTYHLGQMAMYTLGWPVALAAVAGLFVAGTRAFRPGNTPLLVVAAWVVPTFLATAPLKVKFPRYLLPLYPEIMVLAALGLMALVEFISRQQELGRVSPAQPALPPPERVQSEPTPRWMH